MSIEVQPNLTRVAKEAAKEGADRERRRIRRGAAGRAERDSQRPQVPSAGLSLSVVLALGAFRRRDPRAEEEQAQMTEPTAEQLIQREMSLARRIIRQWHESQAHFSDGNGNVLCAGIATALARVRIEAHAAGRDEALGAPWKDLAEGAAMDQWPRGWRAKVNADAKACLRALRGRT